MISRQESSGFAGYVRENQRYIGQGIGLGLFALTIWFGGNWLENNTYLPMGRLDTSCRGYADPAMQAALNDYLDFMVQEEVPIAERTAEIQGKCQIIESIPGQQLDFTPLE